MLLPLGDDSYTRRVPVVNIAIIAVNALVFGAVNVFSNEATVMRVFMEYGLVPADLAWYQFITCMFLHGGWFHIIGNMWFLWVFGDGVENRLGHLGYLVFYLVSGIGASAFYLLFTGKSMIPCVGASGAIFGVVGAYAILYPKNEIKMFYWVGWFWAGTFHVRAYWIIGFWFAEQCFWWYISKEMGVVGGIAYAAHLGGGVVGGLIALGVRAWVPERPLAEPGFDPGISHFTGAGPDAWAPAHPPPQEQLQPLRATGPVVNVGTVEGAEPVDDVTAALAAGNTNRAVELYRSHASCRPGRPMSAPTQAAVAALLFEASEFDEALDAYEAYLSKYAGGPDAPLAKFRSGVILSRRKDRHDEASRLLLEVVMEHPEPVVVALAREELSRIRQLA